MADTPEKTIVGIFADRERAQAAIQILEERGFPPDAVGLLLATPAEAAAMEPESSSTHIVGGATAGVITGGILGGVAGWLLGIGAIMIPGVGPFIAAGALATLIGGAALGIGVGAIAGALAGLGIPADEAAYYEAEVHNGRSLVTVQAGVRYEEARSVLRELGAYGVDILPEEEAEILEEEDAGPAQQAA